MKYEEHESQKAVARWAELESRQRPELALLYAVPNGGKRNPREAARLKAEGVKPGVPDLVLPVARGGYFGLYIEMKSRTGGLTKDQRKWEADLQEQGYRHNTCRSFTQAMELLDAYTRLPKTEVKK